MRDRIAAALKEAMKSSDATRTSTLRLVLAALKDREIAARDDETAGADDDEAAALAILTKMVKQREDSIRAYEEAGRLELAERERAEMEVIRGFLPRPMSQPEIDAAVADAIRDVQASGLKDMGRVMGALKARHPGRMNFSRVGKQVKAALG